MTLPPVPRHFIITAHLLNMAGIFTCVVTLSCKSNHPNWHVFCFLNSQAVTHWKHEAAVGNGRLVDPEGVCNNHPLGQDDTSVTMRRQSAKPQNQCLVWNLGFWYLTEIASTLKVEPWNEFKKYFESSTCYCSDMTRETWTELKRLSQPETCKGFLSKTSKTGKSLVNSPTTWNRIAVLVAGRRCWTCLWRLAELEERYTGAFLGNDAKNLKHPCTSLYSDMTWNYASGLWRFLQAQPTLRLLYTSEVKLQTFSSVCRPYDNGAKVLHGAFKPYDCMVDITKRTWNDSI